MGARDGHPGNRTLWSRARARSLAWPLVAAVAAGTSVLVGCGGAAQGSSVAITLYSGQHVQTTDALVSAFTKKTGISVNIRSDDEDVLADQIVTEGGHSPADVFLTENSPPLQYLAGKGLLVPVAHSTLAHTPARFDSPNGQWEGVSARVSVMIYNTSLLKRSQLPSSVMDLAKSKWKGKIALAGTETDFQPIVTSVARKYGDAAALRWLNALKANATTHLYPDNETITTEVNEGQVALGIINQYYWYREQAEVGSSHMHSTIATFAPHDVGYVIDVSGAGILKTSTHKSADQKFLAFLNSAQGQQIIAHSNSFEYPIGSGVVTAKPETPFNRLQPNSITIAQLGTGALAVRLLQEAQLL